MVLELYLCLEICHNNDLENIDFSPNGSYWKAIEDFSASNTNSTNYKTIGTYTQLIGASEVFFGSSGGGQIKIINIKDGTNCKGTHTLWGGSGYEHCSEFLIDFTTGLVKHRQMYGDNMTKATFTICKYH